MRELTDLLYHLCLRVFHLTTRGPPYVYALPSVSLRTRYPFVRPIGCFIRSLLTVESLMRIVIQRSPYTIIFFEYCLCLLPIIHMGSR